MMQQFATSSSKLAVSGLAMDMNHAEAYAKDAKNTFNESRSEFEKAIADAEQSAFVKPGDFSKGSQVFEKQVYQQPVIKEPVTSDDTSDASHKMADSSAELTVAKEARHGIAENTGAVVIDKSQPISGADNVAKTQDELSKDLITTEKDAVVALHSKSLDAGKPIGDFEKLANEFDYINFVTEIQTLNDEALENSALVTEGITDNEQSIDLTNIRLSEDELQIILDAQQAGVDLQDIMTEEQLTKLNDAINKMLSQFHQQNKSVGSEVSQSDVYKDVDLLDVKLIETMLTQSTNDAFQNLKPAQAETRLDLLSKVSNDPEVDVKKSSVVADTLATEQIDAEGVLESKLERQPGLDTVKNDVGNELKTASEAQLQINKQELSALASDSKANKQTLSALASDSKANKQTLSALASDSKANKQTLSALESDSKTSKQTLSVFDVDSSAVKTDEADPSILTNAGASSETDTMNAAKGEALVAVNSAGQANDATAIPQSKSVKDDNFDVSKQLAMLDERSQTNIIENIKSRVEKFVADLAGNSSKGSEFVAAMQVGLKEFKEQLQSGREPGIDLKALISDAMSQANVDIPAQAQTKVDAALNQFAGLMNLANAVNQSSQAQSHQLFGLTDTQMIKESNALHTEGTKLAQQSPTNFDKAVSIFKPEGQQQLAEKVRWMVNGRNPAAEIRFDPPELGSMQIKINMTADTAAVSFTVQSATAKEALDQAIPKLRDMLQEQGIELGQSSVEQQAKGQSDQRNEQQSSRQANSSSQVVGPLHDDGLNGSQVIEQRIVGGSLGGIDFYA